MRCFLIGNGPSLSRAPLAEYKPALAMNNISLIYPDTDWRPDYYLNIAWRTAELEHWRRCCIGSIDLGIPCFIDEQFRDFLPDADNITWLTLYRDLWCTSLPLIGRHHTSMYTAVQLAIALGFDELVLVGCDMGWRACEKGEDVNHFSPDYYGSSYSEKHAASDNANMPRAIREAIENAKREGVIVRKDG